MYLPYRDSKALTSTYIFAFRQCTSVWDKILPGYTHVDLLEPLGATTLVCAPTFSGCEIFARDTPHEGLEGYRCVRVEVRPRKGQRLIRVGVQTCATVVQYVAHIWLGAITCQALYERLTLCDRDWLRSKGIIHTDVLKDGEAWDQTV